MVLLPTHCPLALPWGSNPGQLHHMWVALTTELPSWSYGGIINSNTQGVTEVLLVLVTTDSLVILV